MAHFGRDGRRRTDEGLATVWAVAWIFVCLMIGWLGQLVAIVVSAQHHLDGAADLSSLSGAAQLERGRDGCAAAEGIARANLATTSRCLVDGQDVVVTVGAVVPLPFGLHGRLTSTARAGP
jgi:secretion/DNA translocation related TadE-like protein